MPRVHVVTDSSAHFVRSELVSKNLVTVVPNRLVISGDVYYEGVNIQPDRALALLSKQSTAPILESPSVDDYVAVYSRLVRHFDAIISVHASRELLPSWDNAKKAAQMSRGGCEIIVIDSQSICAAQGLLVEAAVKAIKKHDTLEEIVRDVRSAVDRLYSVYYVDSLGFLLQNKIMEPAHAILGTMLGIKPFLSFEDGRLVPVEKVKTRNQAVERVVEFASEFDDIEELVILQPRTLLTDSARMIQDRLAGAFTERFRFSIYGATLASLIGTEATGVALLEAEFDGEDYY